MKLTDFLRSSSIGDFSDRLHHVYTPVLLAILSAVVLLYNYVLPRPVQCFTPPEFSSQMVSYVDTYCSLAKTYHVPFTEGTEFARPRAVVSPFHIAPLLYLGTALLFMVPGFFWRTVSCKIGLPVTAMLQSLRQAARTTQIGLCAQAIAKRLNRCFLGSFLSSLLYLLLKLFNLIVVGFVLLRVNVQMGYSFWSPTLGFTYLSAYLEGIEQGESLNIAYPKSIICDFETTMLGTVRRHTVQCVQPLAVVMEVATVFLYFWYLTTFLLTLGSLVYWAVVLWLPPLRTHFLRGYLDPEEGKINADTGLFLRLVQSNVGDFEVQQIVHHLLDDHRKSH